MAGPVLRRRALIAGVGAELRISAEDRLELGGDRRVISARESGRGKGWRRRGGEQLDDERERDEKCGERRSERRQTSLPALRPKRKCPAPETHQTPSDALI